MAGRIIILLVCFFALLRCNSGPVKPAIHYEPIDAGIISDSLSLQLPDYRQNFAHWKSAYTACLQDSLFRDAFYLGLQTNLGIGSISNQVIQNINKQITVFDTSANGNVLDILAINKSANCFVKINLNKNLQDTFYNELIKNLKISAEYSYLAELIDTNQIIFRIATLIDYSIRPDTLVNMLERTKDSSLLEFRKILTTPGNVLLVRAFMIFGFNSEFHLKRKLSLTEEGKFKTETYFPIGVNGDKGSIRLISNKTLQININKNYTVFGQFYSFK